MLKTIKEQLKNTNEDNTSFDDLFNQYIMEMQDKLIWIELKTLKQKQINEGYNDILSEIRGSRK